MTSFSDFTFRQLLEARKIDPATTLLMRHRPREPKLRRAMPWLAEERPDVYNAYQRYHGPVPEAQLRKAAHLASFIAHGASEALFVGLYRVGVLRTVTKNAWENDPACRRLVELGIPPGKLGHRWFDLERLNTLAEYRGRIVVVWNGERSWSRWATSKRSLSFPVAALHQANQLTAVEAMPDWSELVLSWSDLQTIPKSWTHRLREWRGIYLITDLRDGKAYIGSAGGTDNLLGRWLNYAKSGDGGNKLLKRRSPDTFAFSILQRVSPDLDPSALVELENSWKQRLHTRAPQGLNAN